MKKIDKNKALDIIAKDVPAVIFIAEKPSKVLEEFVGRLKTSSEYAGYVDYYFVKLDEAEGLVEEKLIKKAEEKAAVICLFVPPLVAPVVFTFADPESLESFYSRFVDYLKAYFTGERPQKRSSQADTPY